MGGLPDWDLFVGLATPRHKKINLLRNITKGSRTWTDSRKKLIKLRKMEMRSGACNVSLYRAVSLMTVVNELSKRKLNLVGLQVRLDRGGTQPTGECKEE
jgi:hypothetical protein